MPRDAPLVSDWPVLRDCFPRGTVHVPNTVDGICEGVRRAEREREKLRCDISVLRDELDAEWDDRFAQLQRLLAVC